MAVAGGTDLQPALARDGFLAATEPASPGQIFAARSIRVEDGRGRGPDPTERHWVMARGLLESVARSPAGGRRVHQWYRAAVARMRWPPRLLRLIHPPRSSSTLRAEHAERG